MLATTLGMPLASSSRTTCVVTTGGAPPLRNAMEDWETETTVPRKCVFQEIRLGHQVEGAERFEIWVSLITKVARRGLVKAQVGKLTGRDGYRIRRFAQVHDSGPKFNPHWAIEGPRDLVDLLTVGFSLIYLRRDVLRQGFADGRLLPSV